MAPRTTFQQVTVSIYGLEPFTLQESMPNSDEPTKENLLKARLRPTVSIISELC